MSAVRFRPCPLFATVHYGDQNGIRVPSLLYGTAWKEDRTEELVVLALAQGFRGIDTANQRKHYFEAGVGAAIKQAIANGLVQRDELVPADEVHVSWRAG